MGVTSVAAYSLSIQDLSLSLPSTTTPVMMMMMIKDDGDGALLFHVLNTSLGATEQGSPV